MFIFQTKISTIRKLITLDTINYTYIVGTIAVLHFNLCFLQHILVFMSGHHQEVRTELQLADISIQCHIFEINGQWDQKDLQWSRQ